MALKYPDVPGIITANTFSQLNKATLPTIFKILDEMQIFYRYKRNEGVLQINEAVVYTMSMENYDTLRGIEAGWAWSDECAFYREDAFNVLIGRLRDKRGPCQWKGTTTPNGYNFLYNRFVEKPLPGSKIVYARSLDNAQNLSSHYIETLKSQYDKRLAAQELDGQFVNLTNGKVYYSFDRNRHVRKINDTNPTVYIGLDFNVHPLCGVFCSFSESKISIVQELYLEDSNTFEAAKEIIRRYPYRTVTVVSDESGGKRTTKSNTTDREILRRAGLSVINFNNPLVKDRCNNVNRLFDNMIIEIDPSCTKLIADLERLTYDNNDPLLSHISDALGYVCWYLMPLKRLRRGAVVEYR